MYGPVIQLDRALSRVESFLSGEPDHPEWFTSTRVSGELSIHSRHFDRSKREDIYDFMKGLNAGQEPGEEELEELVEMYEDYVVGFAKKILDGNRRFKVNGEIFRPEALGEEIRELSGSERHELAGMNPGGPEINLLRLEKHGDRKTPHFFVEETGQGFSLTVDAEVEPVEDGVRYVDSLGREYLIEHSSFDIGDLELVDYSVTNQVTTIEYRTG